MCLGLLDVTIIATYIRTDLLTLKVSSRILISSVWLGLLRLGCFVWAASFGFLRLGYFVWVASFGEVAVHQIASTYILPSSYTNYNMYSNTK